MVIDRALYDLRSEGADLWNLSLELYRGGQRAQAIQHADKALAIFEQIEDPNAMKVRAQLAKWREEAGD